MSKRNPHNLTDKQVKFCNEYLIDLNATQAAIRAGYSFATANRIGTENLSKLVISKYISELRLNLQKKFNITPESVIQEFAKIGFSNIQDFVNGGNSILELKTLDREKVAAVSSVETTITEKPARPGQGPEVSTTTKLRMHNKIDGLTGLAKHLNLFKEHQKEGAANVSVNLTASEIKDISATLQKDV